MFQSLFSRSAPAYEAIDGPAAARMHGSPDIVFVDVRGADEIARSGTVKGAIRAPLPGLANFAGPGGSGKLPAPASGKSLVLVCASGNRSGIACGQLAELGYGKLYNLRGGFGAYVNAGGPTER